jgi:hypothetical protein
MPVSYSRYLPDHRRKYTHSQVNSEIGKSYIMIECPFCSKVVKAYVWSLAGGGKKCECGAIHVRWGVTFPTKNIVDNLENKL